MTWIMCLIILMVIYIPTIYLIIRKGKKYAVKLILIIVALIFMPIVYIVLIYNFPYYYLVPFEGKVIDSDTKSPIEGAAVLAIYYKEVPSIAGSNSYAIDAQEILTYKNGEFKIPEYKKWFGSNNGEPEGNLLIFKPGYGKFPGSEGTDAVGVSDTWPPPGKFIVYELPKLKTKAERDKNLNFSTAFGVPYNKKKLFMMLINEERANLGYSSVTIEE